MARRFFIEQSSFVDENKIVISGEEYNHIVNVLRARENDDIVVCNNSGLDFYCTIKKIGKKECEIAINKTETNNAEANVNVTVFQALVKGEKFELIAQKLTELGVKKLVPFMSKNVVVKDNTTRLNRLEKISIEASKQCGRAKCLEIDEIKSFKEAIEQLKNYDAVVLAYENAKEPLKLDSKLKNVAIVVGSEGGFDETEIKELSKLNNVQTITMGRRILRAETATIALTSVVMYKLNEWEI